MTRPVDTRRRQQLPDARRGPDGKPLGSRCRPACHQPAPSQAHCTVCHWSFTGVATFDKHRVNGECLEPADLGLSEISGLWSTPEGHAKRAAFGARARRDRAFPVSDDYTDGLDPTTGSTADTPRVSAWFTPASGGAA